MSLTKNARLFYDFKQAIQDAETFEELAEIQKHIDQVRSDLGPSTSLYLDEEIEIYGAQSIYAAMAACNILTDLPAPEEPEPFTESYGDTPRAHTTFAGPGFSIPVDPTLSPEDLRTSIEESAARDIARVQERLAAPPPQDIRLASLLEIPGFLAAARAYETSRSVARKAALDNEEDLVSQIRHIAYSADSPEELTGRAAPCFGALMEEMHGSDPDSGEDLSSQSEHMQHLAHEVMDLQQLLGSRLPILGMIEFNNNAVRTRRIARAAGISEIDMHYLSTQRTARQLPRQIRALADALKGEAAEIHALLTSDALNRPRLQRLNDRIQASVEESMEIGNTLDQFERQTTLPRKTR